MQIALRHVTSRIMVEKAVDVQLAVDMLVMAMRDEYDAAYLLSADGDFTPAVTAAREIAKKVYVAAPMFAAQLACVSNKFIRLDRDWFADCFLS